MADDALARSPLTSDPAVPSEADYAAIHDVMMQTARGRWFLLEFARRSRNADTRMVLDAIARIEQSLIEPAEAPSVGQDHLLAAVRQLVEQAKAETEAMLGGRLSAEQLAAAYRSVRAIREMAWTLRECGADTAICDRLDSQANAIDRNLDRLATLTPRADVEAVFDTLLTRLSELAGDGASPPAAEAAAPPSAASAAAAQATESTAAPFAFGRSADPASTAPLAPPAPPAADAIGTHEAATSPASATPAPAADMTRHAESPYGEAASGDTSRGEIDEAEQAEDRAILDIIAMEMAAPQHDDVSDEATDEPAAAATSEANAAALERAFDLRASAPVSLGAALIANGTVAAPAPPRHGRFADIARLSQAERIALFS